MTVDWTALLTSLEAHWLRAFLFTQAVEMGIYARATTNRPWRERVGIAFAASAMTHPIVWFVITQLTRYVGATGDFRTDYWIGVAVAETFAVLAEATWLTVMGVRAHHALAWSLGANAASFTFGLFCYEHLGW
jgi:hypothetical membrane protein